MKAAVLHGAREIVTEDVPYPILESHGIILKVKACGICGSDLHVYKKPDQEGTIFRPRIQRRCRRGGERRTGH